MSLRFIRPFIIVLVGLTGFHAQAQEAGIDIEWYAHFFHQGSRAALKEMDDASKELAEALDHHDLAREAHARKVVGLINLTHTHDYDTAMILLVQALVIEDSLQLKKEQVFTCLGIAYIFEQVGDYPKSAELLEWAMEINRPFDDKYVLIYILNRLGKVNAASGYIDEAFENYETSLKYARELGASAPEAEGLFNVANLHKLQGDFQQALDIHKKALDIRRSIRDRKSEAVSLNDIGELYRAMKNYERAHANHNIALDIRRSLKDQAAIAESYNNIGALYYYQNNIERAIANLELGLEAARESQAHHQVMRSAEYLSFCYRDLQQFEKALGFKDLFIGMNDLLQNEKNEQRLLDVQNRYEISKKETQIANLEKVRRQREQQLQEEARFRNLLFAIIGLGLIIGVLVVYMYLTKRRSNKVLQAVNHTVQEQNLSLQELNATKDKFFSIISHDLKGPLNSLSSFSGLLINHADSLSKEEITMLAKDLDKNLKNLFALLENLLEWSRSQTGNIVFTPEVFDLNNLLEINKDLLAAQAQNKKITIANHSQQKINIHAHKHSVNTVIRNLVSNAIKFTPEGGKINIGTKVHGEHVVVTIADTGVGMSKEVQDKLFRIDTKHSTKGTADEKGTGLGLILCKEFIEKNGGRIWVESEVGKGSSFHFTLKTAVNEPVAKMVEA
jgi:signal transduction histidine kinase